MLKFGSETLHNVNEILLHFLDMLVLNESGNLSSCFMIKKLNVFEHHASRHIGLLSSCK